MGLDKTCYSRRRGKQFVLEYGKLSLTALSSRVLLQLNGVTVGEVIGVT